MNPLESAFRTVAARRPYKGKTLTDWLVRWVEMSPRDIESQNSQFLKTMTTWIFRKYSGRGGKGVPMGYLGRFVLPETQKVRLFETLTAQVVRLLRKRGLVEVDRQPTKQFRLLVEAWDRAPKQTQGG